MNQELLEILNRNNQINYLSDLENVFIDLREKYDDESNKFEQESIKLLSKIFSIQLPLFLKQDKSYWPWNKSKNEKLYQSALQYVFSNNQNLQDCLVDKNINLKRLITINDLDYNFEDLKDMQKIGFNKISKFLLNKNNFSKFNFYQDNISQVCNQYNISKERFEIVFEKRYSTDFLNKRIAYHFNNEKIKENLTLDFELGASLCSFSINLLSEENNKVFQNSFIERLEENKNIIDWNIVLNGKDPTILSYFISHCSESFLADIIKENLELFTSNLIWITEEASKTKCILNIEDIISKASLNISLSNNLNSHSAQKSIIHKI